MERQRLHTFLYHFLTGAATIGIPLLIYFGTRERGGDTYYGTVGAVLAFVVLFAYLIIPNWNPLRQRGR